MGDNRETRKDIIPVKKDVDKSLAALLEDIEQLRQTNAQLKNIISRYEKLFSRKKEPVHDIDEEIEVQCEIIDSLKSELSESQEENNSQNEELMAQNEELRTNLEEMGESEARFKAIFDNAGMGIAIADMTGRILDCNLAFREMLRYTKIELQEKRFVDLTYPADIDRNVELFNQTLTGRIDEYRIEKRYVRKDGLVIWCRLTVSVVRNNDRAFKYSLAVIDDITERKQADEALKVSERNLAAELDTARGIQQVSTLLIQADDVKVLYNQILDTLMAIMHADFASLQMFYPDRGAGGELQLLGHRGFNGQATKFWEWVRPVSHSTCGVALCTGQRVIVPDVRRCDFMAGSDDLEMYLQTGILAVQTTPLVSRSGVLLGMFSTHWRETHEVTARELRALDVLARQAADLIERIRAEDALKDAKAQAELYLDLMGHDINNMHQIALGYLEMARDMQAIAGQTEFLDRPIEVLQRSSQLIRNVRKLQRLRDGVFQTQETDVIEVLSAMQREFGALPGKTITLNFNGHEHCYVRANELLHDVFANLVSNAIKHTGNPAEITIDVDNVVDEDKSCYRIIVEDDGPGIPDDSKARIFNRMHKGSERGIGLGLYLVKSLADSYGGRVWVGDRVLNDHTKGARFVVLLPAAGQ
jgi:PAS domain S-box-containing protein